MVIWRMSIFGRKPCSPRLFSPTRPDACARAHDDSGAYHAITGIQRLSANWQPIRFYMSTSRLIWQPIRNWCSFDYVADDAGWAHTLVVHPDGSADYIRHRPAQLPCATR